MSKPLIQIGDETREMTDDEYATYQEITKDAKQIEGYIPLIVDSE